MADEKKRYFLVSYSAVEPGFFDDTKSVGFLDFSSSDAKFPSYTTIKAMISETHKMSKNATIVVTNIIELNESDFNDWISNPEITVSTNN